MTRGAPMGKRDDYQAGRVYVQRLDMVDGCYDKSGVYWGAGSLYCGMSDAGTEIYTRAKNRVQALQCFRESYPEITFAKG